MSGFQTRQTVLALFPLLVLALAGGCASPVPGQSGSSGRQITVTMQFAGPPNPGAYYYYFVINRFGATGVQASNCGPIAVYGPSSTVGGYGNGFATGSPGCTPTASPPNFGLTDYVLFSNNQGVPGGAPLGLYHYKGADPNQIPGTVPPGPPSALISYSVPDPTTGNTTVQFTFDVSQLVTDGSTGVQLATEAAAIRFLQVNIIATDAVPTSQATGVQKNTDAMGISNTAQGQSSWLEIDLSQNKTYTNADSAGLPEVEGDVYPSENNEIDLTAWSIQVSNYGG